VIVVFMAADNRAVRLVGVGRHCKLPGAYVADRDAPLANNQVGQVGSGAGMSQGIIAMITRATMCLAGGGRLAGADLGFLRRPACIAGRLKDVIIVHGRVPRT
jgi:hypothetical protein